MNTCDFYQDLISRLVDGEVSREEYEDLMEHMKNCSRCNAMYAVFHDLSEILQSEETEPLPEGLHENIMAGVRRSAIEKKNRRLRATWVRTALTAAACAVLVLFASRGLSPASRTEENMIRTPAEVQMSAVPAEPAAPAAEEAAAIPEATRAPAESPVVQTSAPAPTPTPAAPAPTADPYAAAAAESPAPTPTPAPKVVETSMPKATEAPAPKATEAPAPKATEAPAPKTTETPAPKADETPAVQETPAPVQPAETVPAAETEIPASGSAPAAEEKTGGAKPQADSAGSSMTSAGTASPDADGGKTAADENETAAAPKSFLRSFKSMFQTPASAQTESVEDGEESANAASAEPQESAEPTAVPTPSPTASAKPKNSSLRLAGKEKQEKLTELLGGTEKSLPEEEADSVLTVTLVPEDPYGGEEELSIRFYGDEVYYVTYPKEKETRSFLADCSAAELRALVRQLRSEESPAPAPTATADPFQPES